MKVANAQEYICEDCGNTSPVEDTICPSCGGRMIALDATNPNQGDEDIQGDGTGVEDEALADGDGSALSLESLQQEEESEDLESYYNQGDEDDV